jgi:hypothetical protein
MNLPTTRLRYLRKMPFARMNRRFGTTNMPTAFIRCLRRMPGFAGFWFSYRTSSIEAFFTHGNTVSVSASGGLIAAIAGDIFAGLSSVNSWRGWATLPAAANIRGLEEIGATLGHQQPK